MKKIIQISDDLFWGYNMIIELDNYKSFEELAIEVKNDLINFLNINNLQILKEKAQLLKLHNHSYKNYEELYKTNETVIYLCGHC